jgi:hypothetical protein
MRQGQAAGNLRLPGDRQRFVALGTATPGGGRAAAPVEAAM